MIYNYNYDPRSVSLQPRPTTGIMSNDVAQNQEVDWSRETTDLMTNSNFTDTPEITREILTSDAVQQKDMYQETINRVIETLGFAVGNAKKKLDKSFEEKPIPEVGGFTEEGLEQEVEKFVSPTITDKQTEEVLTDADIAAIASRAIDDAGKAQDNQPNLDDVTTGGLMSPEVTVTSIKMNESVLEKEFVTEYLASHEGTEDHKHDEAGAGDYGNITKAYGIKKNLGLNRDNYDSDKSFAAAVAMKHYVMAEKKYNKNPKGATWSDLGKYGRYAVLDLQFNAGTIGETADFDSPERQLKNTLEFVVMKPKKSNARVSLMSLAERRVKNWNKAADDLGLTKIAKIQQLPNKIDGSIGTTFNFLDKEGNEIYSFENSSPSIDKLLDGGGSTPLTKTKEVSL